MKKSIALILLAAVLTQSCAQKISDAINNATAEFSGKPMETKEFSLSDFTAIHTSATIKMNIVKSSTRKIVIKSNSMQFVEATVKSGELSVHYNNHGASMNNPTTEVTVFTPDFSSLDASSAAKITVEDGFKFEKLSVNVSSAAHITGNFEAKDININASSVAHFSGKVQTEYLNLDSSSSAHIEVSGFAKNVNADASSTAKINLENLKFTTIQKDESSLGKVVTQ